MKKYDDAIKYRDKEPARVRLRELQQREQYRYFDLLSSGTKFILEKLVNATVYVIQKYL